MATQRVKVKSWRGVREMDLEDALVPTAHDCDGQVERVHALAEASAKAFGRLAALLVERRLVSLAEAVEATGVTDDVEFCEG
jgi:hypothetical protein